MTHLSLILSSRKDQEKMDKIEVDDFLIENKKLIKNVEVTIRFKFRTDHRLIKIEINNGAIKVRTNPKCNAICLRRL